MTLLQSARVGFERLLEFIVALLVIALTALIVAGAIFRYSGGSLVWYDEVASIGLVWLTYYGSALAALKGSHIGFAGMLNWLSPRSRVIATLIGEAFVFLFFIVLAWMGIEVLVILGGDRLVSLPSVPQRFTQSVIPIGAVLFMIAEALRLPEVLRKARGEGFIDPELEEVLADLPPEAAAPLPASPSHGGPRP